MQLISDWLTAMSSPFQIVLDAALKGTLLMLLAMIAVRLLHRSSAAVRHRVWGLMFCGLLLLPVLSYALPAWRVPVLPAWPPEPAIAESLTTAAEMPDLEPPPPAPIFERTDTLPPLPQELLAENDESQLHLFAAPVPVADVVVEDDEPESIDVAVVAPAAASGEPSRLTPIGVLLPAWLAGAVLVLLPLGWSMVRNIVLRMRSVRVEDADWTVLLEELRGSIRLKRRVDLLESERPVVPMTWGLVRPVVLLPGQARRWTDRLRRFVLLHELAHVKRWDVGFQLLARVACAVYWFHPLVWYAMRRLRIERELACDDCVVTAGERPADYAAQLLQIARTCRPTGLMAAVAMAEGNSLEHRVRALLDRARSHVPLTRRGAVLLLAASMSIVTAVAVVRPAVREASPSEAEILADELSAGRGGPEEKPETATDVGNERDVSPAPPATVTVRGRVVLPDGSPAAGAVVRAAATMFEMIEPIFGKDFEPPVSEVKADSQGRFSVSFPSAPLGDLSRFDQRWRDEWQNTTIAASLPGYGPQWVAYDEIEDPDQPIVLKLVEDIPIEGRVIDLEGHPLPGVPVRVGGPSASEDEDLSDWIEAARNGETPRTIASLTPRSVDPKLIGVPESVTTDEQGRFTIAGIGIERHLSLVFESETVAHRQVSVVTRRMEPMQRVLFTPPGEGHETVFGAEFTFTAAPSRPIVGTVRDAETGQPMAGVAVESYMLADYPKANHRVLKTVTDENGRYRLIGMPKADGNSLLVLPNDDQPYLIRGVDVPNPPGLGPATVDVSLNRGIWITGRITDKVTGEPVEGAQVYYFPYRSNEFAQAAPEFNKASGVDSAPRRYRTHADGTYRIVGLPGPAVVGADSVYRQFCTGVGFADLSGPYQDDSKQCLDTYPNPSFPCTFWPNVMTQIDPAADAESVSIDLEMDPGLSIPIHLVGPDDEPLTGVDVTGLTPSGPATRVTGDRCEAILMTQDESRTMQFHHSERKLGLVARISPDSGANGPVTVKLQPVATLRARLLFEEGSPMTGATIEPRAIPDRYTSSLPTVATDRNGQFSVTMLPGAAYSLRVSGAGINYSAEITRMLTVEPGEQKDLGDLVMSDDRFVPAESQEPQTTSDHQTFQRNAAPSAASSGSADAGITIRGVLTDESGKPVAAALVAAIGWKLGASRGGDLRSHGEVIAETTTDADGRYELRMPGVSSATHEYTKVLARSESSGLVWQSFDPEKKVVEASFKLAPEQPIRVRLIDVEGLPAAAVRLSINYLASHGQNSGRSDGVSLWDSGTLPDAWPAGVTTDDEGRCIIRHVAADCGVHLSVEGDDRFARQDLAINTGLSEFRGEHDATYRPLVKNAGPGEEAALVLAPAQIIEGVIRYEDTGDPVPQAPVNIWASQQEFGSMISVDGQTDAEGRYRIHPYPGVQFGVLAYPPRGTPYLVRQVSRIPWPTGERVKQVDVNLPRGVLIRGKVLEAGTGQPVVGATVQYIPRQDNPHAPEDIVTGWQGIQLSEEDGTFEIAVLPGAGTLLFHGPQGEYVLEEIASRQIQYGRPGGARYYAHAVKSFDLEPGAQPLDLTVELQRGERASGRLVDESGAPIERALMITRLDIAATMLWWRGIEDEVTGGQFERVDLAPGREYDVYFLDPERQLGAAATLRSGAPDPTIVMRPCGQATARYVNGSGEPLEGIRPGFEIVVTPGASRLDADALQQGRLTADADFVANVDRKNHWNVETDGDGCITYPALIPGATYRIDKYVDGRRVTSDFTVKPGETVDLGEIVIDENG